MSSKTKIHSQSDNEDYMEIGSSIVGYKKALDVALGFALQLQEHGISAPWVDNRADADQPVYVRLEIVAK